MLFVKSISVAEPLPGRVFILSMIDAPYAICETNPSCRTAAESCFGVLSMINAPYAICETNLSYRTAAESCFGVLPMVDAPYACKTKLLAAGRL